MGGAVMAWGMELMDELTEAFMRTGNVEGAIKIVIATHQDSGEFEAGKMSRTWFIENLRAVADHPESFGHSVTYWGDLKRGRAEAAAARARKRLGGVNEHRQKEEKGSTDEGSNGADPD